MVRLVRMVKLVFVISQVNKTLSHSLMVLRRSDHRYSNRNQLNASQPDLNF